MLLKVRQCELQIKRVQVLKAVEQISHQYHISRVSDSVYEAFKNTFYQYCYHCNNTALNIILTSLLLNYSLKNSMAPCSLFLYPGIFLLQYVMEAFGSYALK